MRPLAINRDARIIYIQGAMKQRRWVAGYNLRFEANELSGITAGCRSWCRVVDVAINHPALIININVCRRLFQTDAGDVKDDSRDSICFPIGRFVGVTTTHSR